MAILKISSCKYSTSSSDSKLLMKPISSKSLSSLSKFIGVVSSLLVKVILLLLFIKFISLKALEPFKLEVIINITPRDKNAIKIIFTLRMNNYLLNNIPNKFNDLHHHHINHYKNN